MKKNLVDQNNISIPLRIDMALYDKLIEIKFKKKIPLNKLLLTYMAEGINKDFNQSIPKFDEANQENETEKCSVQDESLVPIDIALLDNLHGIEKAIALARYKKWISSQRKNERKYLNNQFRKLVNNKARELNICTVCLKNSTIYGCSFCEECKRKMDELKLDRISKKLCSLCGQNPLKSKTLCIQCLEKYKQMSVVVRNHRKKQGLCPACGKKTSKRYVLCLQCRKKRRLNYIRK